MRFVLQEQFLSDVALEKEKQLTSMNNKVWTHLEGFSGLNPWNESITVIKAWNCIKTSKINGTPFEIPKPPFQKHFYGYMFVLIFYDSVLILLAPVAGSLVNKFSCRSVSIAGSLIAFLGFTLSTLSTNIKVLSLTYGVIGGKHILELLQQTDLSFIYNDWIVYFRALCLPGELE